ncbi:uncharacterized protein [Henckelia pumila]|uniref:uncharacterized protein n=1 Tax=Henckelia pumila TaxID=405737 RepID=UPI003C6E9B0C
MEIADQVVRTGPTLSFGPDDLKGLSDTTHNDALIIRAMVANYNVAQIFVDFGSSVNVLFQETINQMDLGEYKVEPVVTSLFGFTDHAIRPTGLINLPLTLGKDRTSKTRIVSFIIVDAPSAYNVILGRPAMTTFMAVASALYQKIKFLVGNEVGEVQGDQKISRKFYVEEGYHQIPLAKEDQNKVSFVTSTGTYCYVVMPFGLKNAGATYQRLIDKVFKQQIGKNIEVYVDDILVKSRIAKQFIADLTQTFQTLREYRLMLNPSKCTFGVQTGKFLGYMELKAYLRELPVLNKPVQGKELFVYLAVMPRAASSVIVRKEGMNHLPVYFVSHALKGAELNYMTQEKLALALVITARKLRPYFLSHPIIVLTNSALGKIAANPDASGRLIKWITELSEYDIKFEPRTAIKAQALADFLEDTVELGQEDHWKIFVDGSSCQTGSGVGIVTVSPWGKETNISIRLDFRASNNEAEYETLLLGLKAAWNLGISRATLYSDSQLAIQQSKGKFKTKNEKMIKYVQALDKAKEDFTELLMELIPRTENTKADHLARLASSVGEPSEPGLKGKEMISQLESLDDIIADVLERDWRYDIHKHLTKNELLNDSMKAREIKRRALRFVMVDKILFKSLSSEGPLGRLFLAHYEEGCIRPDQLMLQFPEAC